MKSDVHCTKNNTGVKSNTAANNESAHLPSSTFNLFSALCAFLMTDDLGLIMLSSCVETCCAAWTVTLCSEFAKVWPWQIYRYTTPAIKVKKEDKAGYTFDLRAANLSQQIVYSCLVNLCIWNVLLNFLSRLHVGYQVEEAREVGPHEGETIHLPLRRVLHCETKSAEAPSSAQDRRRSSKRGRRRTWRGDAHQKSGGSTRVSKFRMQSPKANQRQTQEELHPSGHSREGRRWGQAEKITRKRRGR